MINPANPVRRVLLGRLGAALGIGLLSGPTPTPPMFTPGLATTPPVPPNSTPYELAWRKWNERADTIRERRYYRVGGLDHDLAAMRSWSDGHRAMRQRERDEAANNELSAFRRVLKLL